MQTQPASKPTCETPNAPAKSSNEAKLLVLVGLSETFGKVFSAPALAMMVQALADVSLPDLERAASRAIAGCKFWPTVAELRELAGVGAATMARAEELAAWDAAQAWVKRNRDRLRNSTTGALAWDDGRDYSWRPEHERPSPIVRLPARIEAALRSVGGPDTIQRASGTESEEWLKKSFCEAYKLAEQIGEARQALTGGTGLQLVESLTRQIGGGQ